MSKSIFVTASNTAYYGDGEEKHLVRSCTSSMSSISSLFLEESDRGWLLPRLPMVDGRTDGRWFFGVVGRLGQLSLDGMGSESLCFLSPTEIS